MDSSVFTLDDVSSTAKAFSKQAIHFDQDDISNPILVNWRKQVYEHVDHFLKPRSHILELNAGTGIDAMRFARGNHIVHATDLSKGMINEIEKKVRKNNLKNLTYEQCSFDSISQTKQINYDFVFSNFGGLNCCKDLEHLTKQLTDLIKPDGYVTWVIMPPFCLWELLWIFKGKKAAFRRLKKGGTMAHLEGENFNTYYHSLKRVKLAFGPKFKLKKVESLGLFIPPPDKTYIPIKYPSLFKLLMTVDKLLRKFYPFNRIGDHLIMTFQFNQ